jgi:predicted permease
MHGIRQTLRTLWRSKAFTVIAVSMLALGIGAMTAIFSVVNVVILQSSYREPARLFAIEELVPKLSEQYPSDGFPVNGRHFDEWRKACTVCSGFGLMQGGGGANLGGEGDRPPERVRTLGVTHDLLPTLGVAPALGRTILPSDDKPDAPRVIMLTDAFWKRRFQADSGLVGTDIRLNGNPVTVIGVLPRQFEAIGGAYLRDFGFLNQGYEGLRPAQLPYSELRPRGGFNYGAVVRLKPGATPEQAVDQMNAAIRGFSEESNLEMFARLRPLDEAILGGLATGLWMLLASVGAVLLIVCVNLGNLMLVRAERRRREAAVRRALGATSFRLLGQVVREGLVLAFLGGALGVLVARWAIDALVLTAPVDLPRLHDVRLDWTALSFGLLTMWAAGILTSVLPALRYGRGSLQDTLREAQATATASGRRVRSRGALVALEVALSAVLLIVAALMGTSLFRLMSVEKGFASENVLSFDLVLPPRVYPFADGSRGRFHDQLIERLAVVPGVRDAGLTTRMPLEGSTYVDSVRPEGTNRPLDEQLITNYRFVSPGYWRAMGIPLLEGRLLEPADRDRLVAVISQDVARKVWPGENAIGKRFLGGPSDQDPYEVVGVVADVHTAGLAEQTVPIAYLSYWQRQFDAVSYAVRTTGDAIASAGAIRQAVWSIDPALPVTNIRTMDQVVGKSVAPQRFLATLAGLFSFTALLLAALGVYGVVSYAVAGRTSEIGLRMALGAEARNVLGMILGQGMRPIVVGLVAGLGGAALLARVLESQLFEISARDPLVYAGVGALLIAVSLLACYIPARRAARVDPITALRYE